MNLGCAIEFIIHFTLFAYLMLSHSPLMKVACWH